METNKLELELVISFTYRIKRRGSKIEPCGTPHTISLKLDLQLLYETYCVILLR